VTALRRLPRNDEVLWVPRPLPATGRFEVDATWGRVQSLELAPGVRTIGELELIAHLEAGGVAIDTRLEHHRREATIPGSVGMPHGQILDRRDEIDPDAPAAYFCNGPQCAATPDAIHRLLGIGHPAAAMLYYRGGMHDWMTLGFPVVRGQA